MYKNVAVIIPALEKNRHSPEGDLVKFGDLSLLEWKLALVRNFVSDENIFVSTPSKVVAKVVKACDVNAIHRKESDKMADVIVDAVKKTGKEIILWTHVTSPFVSAVDFKSMMDKFLKLDKKFDSLISVLKLQEFIMFRNAALNFEILKVGERKLIEPAYQITNGCYIARRETYLKHRNYFGTKPFLYEIDALASMEIKEMDDLAIASHLISLFFKKGLHV